MKNAWSGLKCDLPKSVKATLEDFTRGDTITRNWFISTAILNFMKLPQVQRRDLMTEAFTGNWDVAHLEPMPPDVLAKIEGGRVVSCR